MASNEIEYPPFCELCIVKFSTNANAKTHYDGVNHYNRVMMVQRRNNIKWWCEICCCELNTEEMLRIHKESPKHTKKEEALTGIQELKELYMKHKQEGTGSFWNKMEAENFQPKLISMTNE